MTITQTIERLQVNPTFVTTRPEADVSPKSLGDNLMNCIGNTPLLPLHRLAAAEGINPDVVVFAKAEWFNASGSVKARPALAMIEEGERTGQLTPDKTIVEATSGNTGIAMAMIGAAKGYKVKLVMPKNVSSERKAILQAYGADLLLTDPLEGIDYAIRTVRQLTADNPDDYFYPDQYNNPVNWQAHYHSTGVEIWHQTGGQVTHFVAGLGTTGTFMGTSKRLKNYNNAVQAVALEPADELAIIEGLKHMETSIVPGIYEETYPDQHVSVLPDDAHTMTERLAREEGMFVGFSGGAAAWAALEVAKTLEQGVVVTLLPDGGEKYLSVNN